MIRNAGIQESEFRRGSPQRRKRRKTDFEQEGTETRIDTITRERKKLPINVGMPKWARWITAALVCVMGLKTLQIGVRRDWTLECENTWSICGYREWFGFVKTHHWKKASALEGFIQENYPGEFTNRWRSWHAPSKNWLGQPIYCSSRQLPENGGIVDQYITGLSDPEKKALYDFFRSADAEAGDARMDNIWYAVSRGAGEGK